LFGNRHVPEDPTDLDVANVPVDEEDAGVEPEDSDTGENGDGVATDESVSPEGEGESREAEPLDDPAQRLAEELETLNDRYLRLAAEFDNFRRRTRKETADLSAIAQVELVRKVLPAMDDLARVAAIPNDTITVEALDQGIELILRNLLKELAEVGLERIEAVGERFDPEIHQGMMVSPTDDPELDDMVSRVFVDGYEFRGRLVRPAQVEVLNFEPEGVEDAG
jgi:molecular chaperone GrpE